MSEQDAARGTYLRTELTALFDDQMRDQRELLIIQQRMNARLRAMAQCVDQLCGTTLLARHYQAQAPLPYAAENQLR